MATITLLLLASTLISLALITLSMLIGKKTLADREKLTPFECGFDPNKKARAPFSLRFFIITILFLVFDVELVLMFPLGVLANQSDPLLILTAGTLLILLVTIGLIHEWNQGALVWVQ